MPQRSVAGFRCRIQSEFPSLDFKEIRVPEQHLLSKGEPSSSSGVTSESCSSSKSESSIASSGRTSDSGCASNPSITTTTSGDSTTAISRKRKYSENFSDSSDIVRPKKIVIESINNKNESLESTAKGAIDINSELKDLCMMCTTEKKDGIFLHGSSAHSCCCYRCAVKTWKTTKRCPICNRRVSNVVKLYTI